MSYFDPHKYQSYLFEEKKELSQRASELKAKIGQEEGAMESWSQPAQKAMRQDLETTLVQLGTLERGKGKGERARVLVSGKVSRWEVLKVE